MYYGIYFLSPYTGIVVTNFFLLFFLLPLLLKSLYYKLKDGEETHGTNTFFHIGSDCRFWSLSERKWWTTTNGSTTPLCMRTYNMFKPSGVQGDQFNRSLERRDSRSTRTTFLNIKISPSFPCGESIVRWGYEGRGPWFRVGN